MKFKWIGAALAVAMACAAGCSEGDETQTTVEPQTRGQRGESCQARNDCQEGLACIAQTCSRNDFDVDVSVLHCDQIDCSVDTDCCGNKPLEAPAKCDDRDLICFTPSLPNCITTSCTSDATCGGGICGNGFCSESGLSCTTLAQCTDECGVDGFCTLSNFACTVATETIDCQYFGQTCTGRVCNCSNPAYDPTDPICNDPDCEDICTLRCREERCIQDNSCEEDIDCAPFLLPFCLGGLCVECTESADCNEDIGETCIDNRCDTPCLQHEECPLFHQCVDGECVETGCTGDRECVLAASTGSIGSVEDARLSKCLPSDIDPTISTCKVPCENDGSCADFQICDAGYCRFIGCMTDEECRSYLGLSNIDPEVLGYAPRAVCRE
jgi:hypothetical protein